MATSVGNLWVDVRFDTSRLGQNLRGALGQGAEEGGTAAEASLGQRMTAIGQKATVAGRAISYGLSIPMIAFGKVATSAFADFDQKMTRITALSGVPRATVQGWEKDVKSLATTYGQSATDTADALYFITSSGIEASNAMNVLDVSAKAAAVGMGQQQAIADLITSSLNAYGQANLSAAEAGDVLTASVRLGKAEADKMAGAMASVIPLASNLKVPMAEMAGAMASMTLSGTSPDEAATQLRNLFNVLGDMPVEGKAALKELAGIDYEQMRKDIPTKGFINTLKEIFDILKARGMEGRVGEIFGPIRAQTGLLNLFGEKSAETLNIIRQVKDSAGDLNKAWEETAGSPSFKLKQATEDIKTSLIAVGAAVAPAMTTVSQGVAGLVGVFGKLHPAMQTPVVALGAMAAAAGPLTYSFGALARVGGGLFGTMSRLSPSLAGAAASVRRTGEYMNAATANTRVLGVSVGGLGGIVSSAGILIGGAVAVYAIWNAKMEEGAELARNLGNTYREAAGKGGIGAAQETIAKTEKEIAGLNEEISSSHAPWDADYRAELLMGREELERGVGATRKFIDQAREMAAASGQSADALYGWLAKQGAAGTTFNTAAEALAAYTKALQANDPAAVAASQSNTAFQSSLEGVISAAKTTAEKFMGFIDAQKGYTRALKAIKDAEKGVVDAQFKYADAERATVAAERAIGEAQRKAIDATKAVTAAKEKLTEAQTELNDVLAGPSPEEQLNLESAQLGVQEAQKRARGKFDTVLDRRRAQLELRRARLDLEREQESHDKKIADSCDKVTEAETALGDAQQSEVDANAGVVDAIAAREEASRKEAEAYEGIAIARDNVRQASEDLVPAVANLAEKQAALETAIGNSSANGEAFIKYLETLKAMEPGIAGVIDQYIQKWKDLAALHAPQLPPAPPAKTPGDAILPGDRNLPPMPEPEYLSAAEQRRRRLPFPGRAKGGPVAGGSLYEVNERNIPELLLSGTRQFLLPVDSGQVVPLEPSTKGTDKSVSVGDINIYEATDGRGSAAAVRRELRKVAFLSRGSVVSYPVTFPDRYAEIAGLPLSTPAWELLNIEVLLAGMQARGSNLVIPHARGTRARRRRHDQRTVTLELAVTGAYSAEGDLNDDAALGLLVNLDALAAVLDPPGTTDSLVAVKLNWRGIARSGFAQVESYEIGAYASPADVPMTVDLTFPHGGWTT